MSSIDIISIEDVNVISRWKSIDLKYVKHCCELAMNIADDLFVCEKLHERLNQLVSDQIHIHCTYNTRVVYSYH